MGLVELVGKQEPIKLDTSPTLWNDLRGVHKWELQRKWNTTTVNIIFLTPWVEGGASPLFLDLRLTLRADTGGKRYQLGSLAATAHLLKEYASVLGWA